MVAEGRWKGFLGGAFLLLVSVSLCLVLAEWLFTLLYEQEQERLAERKAGSILCTDRSEFPELIYTRKPLTCGANSRGFRDYEYPYTKEEGVARIVVIGDSVADGYGLDLEDSFGKVLERTLNGPGAGLDNRVEVIILAQGGYSTTQELFLLEHEAYRYDPDLVVWSYVLNDPAHPVYRGASGEVGDYFYEPRSHALHFVLDKLFKIAEKFRAIGCGKEFHELLHCAYWGEVEANIGRIAEVTGERETPVIFVIHPIIEDNGNYERYSLAPLHARLAGAARGAGLYALDLLDAYRPHEPAALALSGDGWHDIWHPNEEGHRIAAKALKTFIEQQPELWARLGGRPVAIAGGQ